MESQLEECSPLRGVLACARGRVPERWWESNQRTCKCVCASSSYRYLLQSTNWVEQFRRLLALFSAVTSQKLAAVGAGMCRKHSKVTRMTLLLHFTHRSNHVVAWCRSSGALRPMISRWSGHIYISSHAFSALRAPLVGSVCRLFFCILIFK